MDTVTLVDEQIRDGEKLLDRLAQEGLPVRAAGWVKPMDEDRWSLYLVTPLVDEQGPIGAYREVYRVLRSLEDVRVKDYDVKLVGEGQRIASDLLEAQPRYPARGPQLSRLTSVGGMPVEGVYVYPLAKMRLCLPVAYVYRREDSPGSRHWHRNSRIIAPAPTMRRPGFLLVLEATDRQVILIFAVPCDEQGSIPQQTQEEYEDLADQTFTSVRPGQEKVSGSFSGL